MHEHNNTPYELSNKNGNKDTNLNTITPAYELEKYGIGVEDIKTEAEKLLSKNEAPPHAEILDQL
ncbi:MAG: hypothetical protein ACOVMG_00440, partial [Flavobacterium sp.]